MKINHSKIAKEAVENFIKNKAVKNFPDSKNTKDRAGVFVSIYKKSSPSTPTSSGLRASEENELRGCIGTFAPTRENIISEIVHNAIAAATSDFRFSPITVEELPNLCYSVDILKTPKPVKNIKELDPKKYGVIVKTLDGKCGLLLPDIKGINNTNQQMSIACQKAGINPVFEKIFVYKFAVDRYKE